MKRFARLNYDNFIINGEVNERLPLYNEHLQDLYPLDNNINNVMPLYKISSGNVTRGSSSLIISKSNVTISNDIMQFTGNDDSYIELHSDIMDAEKLEIEFNFKVNSLSSDATIFNSDDLIVKIDSTNKFIYAEMPNLTGKHTPIPDLSNGAFRITSNETITLNTWYRLKIIKYEAIVCFIFEHDIAKALVCENGFNPTTSYLGKGLCGEIESINIWKPKEYQDKATITIPNPYSLYGIINLKKNSLKTLLQIGDFSISQDASNLNINGTSVQIVLNRDYGLSCGFEDGSLRVILRDTNTNFILYDETLNITYSNTCTAIADNSLKNLSIYDIRLSNEKLLAINKRRFSLNKDGDILYEVNEINGYEKLKTLTGKKYHLQLTNDLNSDCNTVTNNIDVEFVEGGVKSNLDNKKIKLSFIDAINLSNTWDLVYRTNITSLTSGMHYDSLAEGLCWGIENNKFVLKHDTTSSYIEGLNANEVLNEWLLISVTYSSNKVTLLVCTSKGIFSTSITKEILLAADEYDIFFGGIEDTIYGQAIYRNFTIINGWNVDSIYKEKLFRTKFSFSNNKITSNVNIVEQVNSL